MANAAGGTKKPLVCPLRRRLHAVYHKPGPTATPLSFALGDGSEKNGVCLG